jgi:ubiquinone/menaquinone biosynthesis C-methylase UbiE
MSDRIRRIYDQRAADYDRSVGRAEGVLLGDFRRRFGALLAGETLEVGIGSGLNLPFYGPAVTRASGIDLSAAMLRIARERAESLGRKIVLTQGDAERLPFPDAAFDTVAVSLVLCTVPEPARALREVARVCRPGGRVVLMEHVLSPVAPAAWAQRLIAPLQEHAIGCDLTRRTIETARGLGFRVESEEARLFGIFRLVVARPPAA